MNARCGAALCAAVLGLPLACTDTRDAPRGDAPEQRPNVLLIVADDLDARFALDVRRPDSGEHAYPHLRSIAERGVLFRQSFVTLPLCSPSRATILTGRYAHNHGVLGNAEDVGGYAQFRDDETLAVWLARAGYRTAMAGKYLNGYSEELAVEGRMPTPRGWERWFGSLSPASYFGWRAARDGAVVSFGGEAGDYHTDVVAREALASIDAFCAGEAPWFLAVNFFAPHDDAPGIATPAVPAPRHAGAFARYEPAFPPSFDEADVSDKPPALSKLPRLQDTSRAMLVSRLRARLEAMLAVDEAVGAFLARLADRGALDRTVVIFTSDNGFQQGEHRIRTGKGRAYDESIRVPLAACGPGIRRGVASDALVLDVDLAPSILELTGARAAFELDGRSWLAVMRDASSPWRRDFLLRGTRDNRFTALRSLARLYVEHDEDGDGACDARELYVLMPDERAAADPFELDNRAMDPRFADELQAARTRLEALISCRGTSCW